MNSANSDDKSITLSEAIAYHVILDVDNEALVVESWID